LQPFLDEEDASPLENPASQKKALEVFARTDNAYKLARKYNVKTAFGTTEPEIRAAAEAADNWGTYVTVHAYTPRAIRQAVAAGGTFCSTRTTRQGAILAKMVRWYTPAEVLKTATADNGELMGLSGFINPYPGETWCGRTGRNRRSAVNRWQSAGKYQACCRARQELSRHYEG
jgi:imidazolonepropionase-like amidohydrolase